MGLFTGLRRKRLAGREFPQQWLDIVERNVPFYSMLPLEDRRELLGHIQVFLSEKYFEGCGGASVTDEVRVTVAALACILLLHRKTGYYPLLSSIVIYPDEYVGERQLWDEAGVITEGPEPRVGESWGHGTVVLSWKDVLLDAASPDDAYNVVFHEFAHQLDQEEGITGDEGFLPGLPQGARWRKVFEDEYGRLMADDAAGRRTLLDPYGAESPAEFFAVATETFFEMPGEMRRQHPELYEALSQYYRQDPESWTR